MLVWVGTCGALNPGADGATPGDAEPLPAPTPLRVPEAPDEAAPVGGGHPVERMVPFFLAIDGAVLHDTNPLIGAWSEDTGDGVDRVFLGIWNGLTPTDVAVVELGTLGPDEEIVAVTDAGVTVQGTGGLRDLSFDGPPRYPND